MRILVKIWIMAIIIVFNGCKNKKQDNRVENIRKMKDKVVEFPDTVNSVINYTAELNEIYNNNNIKIINFTDGRCSACIKKLKGLDIIRKELDTIQGADINLISFVLIENKKKFMRNFYPELDNLPLILVDDYRFLEKNKLPVSGAYHTFLANGDNKVQLVGNPYQNKKLKKLYRKKIKTIVEKNKNQTPQKSLEAKVIERTKAKFKEENKTVIEPLAQNGQDVGIFHLEHHKTMPMVINKNAEIYYSLMNAESNQEPVILKISKKSGETIREVKSKLHKISYFSLKPDTNTIYNFKASYKNEKGEAVLFYYFVR